MGCQGLLVASERFEIPLDAQAQLDPLIQFTLPTTDSPDKAIFTRSGLRVIQRKDIAGKKSTVSGFKIPVNVDGDFEFSLDLKCVKMNHPEKGWGHGVMIRVILDDERQPVLVGGCITQENNGRALEARVLHEPGEKPDRVLQPVSFQQGTLTASRVGNEFVLTAAEKGKPAVEIARLPCSTAKLSGIHVWCSRLPKDNAEAEYLLQRVRFEGDELFTYETAPPSYTWYWIFGGLLVINGILIGGYLLLRSTNSR